MLKAMCASKRENAFIIEGLRTKGSVIHHLLLTPGVGCPSEAC